MQSRRQLEQLAKTLAGIPVWGALPGSLSQRAGVRYGDVVLSVNGRPTANIDDYLEARNLRTDGVEVVLFRDGEQLTVRFEFQASHSPPEPRALLDLSAQLADARMLPTQVSDAPRQPDN